MRLPSHMQHDTLANSQTLRSELAALRGLWLGIEGDLHRMGIACLADLRGCRPEALVETYRRETGHPSDPILRPYFAALVAFAETGVATPWWRIMRAEAVRDSEAALVSVI